MKLILIFLLFALAMWLGAKAGHVLDRHIEPIQLSEIDKSPEPPPKPHIIKYSIGGIPQQDASFRKWNGKEDTWCQINFFTPDEQGRGSIFGTSGCIGPVKRKDAENWINARLKENPLATWDEP